MSNKTLGEDLEEYVDGLSEELLDVIEYYEYSDRIDEASKRKLNRVLNGLDPIRRFVRHARYEEDDDNDRKD